MIVYNVTSDVANCSGEGQMFGKVEHEDKMNRYIRERIKEAREERGMSQDDLAKPLYKTRVAVSDLERGRVQAAAADLVLIAFAVEKPITYFFPPQLSGPQAADLSPREKELVMFFRRLVGFDDLEAAAVRQVQTLAEAAEKLGEQHIRLEIEGKLPD